jgi:hypothetical protein
VLRDFCTFSFCFVPRTVKLAEKLIIFRYEKERETLCLIWGEGFLSCCSPNLSTEGEWGGGEEIQFPKRRVVSEHVAVDTVHRPTEPAFEFAGGGKVQS